MKKLTAKQCDAEKRTARRAVGEMKIALQFSITLYENHANDLAIELKEARRIIRKSRNTLKKLGEKLDENS